MTLDLRLVAYAPNGAQLGLLAQPLSWEAACPLNDVSSLTLAYSRHAVGAGLLATPCEVAVEYSTGGAWIEPLNARFLRIKRGGDQADQTGTRSYTLPGYAWQLGKLLLYAGGTMVEGKRQFSAVSPGAILRTFTNEGTARGTLPGLAVDFTASTDSAGQPWATTLTLELEPGVDLRTLLINLAEQGTVDWAMQGRTLRVWNEGTVLAPDLAAGSAPVDLRLGRDVVEAPDEATLEEVAGAILIEGEDGFSLEVTNPSAIQPWGRWESHQKQGGVKDTGTATLLGQAALERTSRERVQVTRGITLAAARWLPWADYTSGATILAPGEGGAMEPLRIRQLTLSKDNSGELGGNLVLNDRFLEADLKLARRMAGILGGGVASGGSGTDPAPEQPSGRTPAAPTGLIVNPAAYLDTDGAARGQITATWSPVAADVDGVAIDVDGYELYVRINAGGHIWRMAAQTDGGDTSVTTSPFDVGQDYAFKVRATADGTKGVFSSQVAVTIPGDVTPPPVPTAPILASRLGVIEVEWDGQGTPGPVAMPIDFDRVRVWMASASGGPYTAVDYLDAAGKIVVADQPYNAVRWFRFTALDRSGNESAASAEASVATQPLVGTDVIGEVINGANIVDGSITASDKVVANTITGALIQALAIATGHLQANAVTTDKLAAGSVTAGKLEAILALLTRIVAGNPSGARVEINSSGIEAFNASAMKTVEMKSSDGSVSIIGQLASGASGRRVIVAPTGATRPEIRFYPSGSSSNYSTIYNTDGAFVDETTMFIETGQNNAGTAHSQLTIAAGIIRAQIYDAGNYNPGGGVLDVAEDYTMIGFDEGGINASRFWFDQDGFVHMIGEWTKVANPQTGLIMDQIQFVGTLGTSGASITFGTTYDDAPFPIAMLNDTPVGGQYGSGINIYSRLSSGFSFRGTKDSNGDFALIYWAWRQ